MVDLSSSQTAIAVEPLSSPADYARCQDVQRRTWRIADEGYLMPISVMTSVHKHGGLVLGARAGSELVGFSFAFLAQLDGQLGFYSQLTAVLPEWQGKDVGYLLKQAQRAEAERRGLKLVAWAFDPLQAGNAAFNLNKLGAHSRRYEVDLYGPRADPLNVGLDTDRLIVEWPVGGPPREAARTGSTPVRLLELERDGEWWKPVRAREASEQTLGIDVPHSIQTLKQRRPDLARAWQHCVRQAFLDAFARGYVATRFVRAETEDRCWYLLER